MSDKSAPCGDAGSLAWRKGASMEFRQFEVANVPVGSGKPYDYASKE
jgi:hypothetical protein